MTAATRADLWERLRVAGLVADDMPPADGARAPWYVRVMLGAAGWIGAMFLLSFVGVGLAFIVRNAAAAWVVGAAACAGAAFLFRKQPGHDFVSQFALAVSLAGQSLMAFGILEAVGERAAPAALAIALQQAVLFVLLQNFVHRVWCAWSGAIAVTLALADLGLAALAPAAVTAAFAAVWLAELDHAERGEMLRAGGYGLGVAAVQTAVVQGLVLAMLLGLLDGRTEVPAAVAWAGAIASGLVLIGVVIALLKREGAALSSRPARIALATAAILALAALAAPGVAAAAAILVVGFANGNRVLAGLGIAALVGYLSHYYYSLDATLLEKSGIMAVTGAALLAARLALVRFWPLMEERERA